MRYAKLAFALLGFAAVLVAADPFAGTWKLNTEKSKYKTGTLPKEATITISESGSDLDVTVKGTAGDGSPISGHYTVPAQGGDGKIIEFPYDAVSAKRVGPNQREVRYSKGGKVVYTVLSRISADGKTLTNTSKGSNPQGQMVEGTSVYEKQ
jgi:hypothetical protein